MKPLFVICGLVLVIGFSSCGQSPREPVTKLVEQVRQADYEGDRASLARLCEELAPYAADKEIGARVRYWRGFAQWRRAINGFNDAATPGELHQALKQAISEFEAALEADSSFADARVAAGSSMGLLMYLCSQNPEIEPELMEPARAREIYMKALSYQNAAEAAEPENPRVLWVVGQTQWIMPAEHGGGQEKAIETYQKGLRAARELKGPAIDPLTPAWGEPELLMNLAWASLNRTPPDPKAAEEFAREALAIVPNWHYVRDILVPQIAAATVK